LSRRKEADVTGFEQLAQNKKQLAIFDNFLLKTTKSVLNRIQIYDVASGLGTHTQNARHCLCVMMQVR